MDVDGRLQQGSEFKHLDYNENSRASTKNNLEIHGKTEDLSAISAFAMDLPMPLVGQSSNISDKQIQPDLPPLISGLDDTLNNDFFYDDEFTVPFDANLSEDCQSLPAEVDSLLRRLLPGTHGIVDDDNEEWRRSRMALSKSDSCLYQADQELTDSEREMSMSDHDLSSSSNNSPLQNQSLFSSSGEPAGVEASGCNGDGVTDSVLSGSLTRDTTKYNYDWTLNKQQYILMFDRSPTKTGSSEEDSFHQICDNKTRITSWSRAKSGRQKRRVEEQNSSGSPVRKVDRENKSVACPVNGSPARKVEREKKPTACLTTWGQVKKQQQSSPCSAGGLTTWQQVKQSHTNSFKTVGWNVLGIEDRQMETVLEEMSSPPEGFSGVKLSPVDDTGNGTLVNIYCKMKTQEEMNEFQNNEAMASPLSLEKLLETWTESLVLAGPDRMTDVVYNSSRTDLIPIETRASRGSGNGHNMSGACKNKRGTDSPVLTGFSPRYSDDTNTEAAFVSSNANPLYATTAAQQAGSAILTSSLLRGHDTVDCSIQFPPASMDCAVQTSFTFSESQSSLMESKAQQTSVIAVAVTTSKAQPDNAVGYSYAMDNKMALSAHALSRPLPDLSFLKKTANLSTRKSDDSGDTFLKSLSPRAQSEPRNPAAKQPSAEEEALHEYGKPLFECRRSADVKASSSSDSRDSSPRPVVYRNRSRSSDSTSTYSVCSTSSSGIDPGFYDSSGSGGTRTPRMSRIFDDGSKAPVPTTEAQKTPPKPPRLFAAASDGHLPRQIGIENNIAAQREAMKLGGCSELVVGGLCTACNLRISSKDGIDGAKALASSHPIYFREKSNETNNLKQIEYLQVSPTHTRARYPPEKPPTLPKKLSQDFNQPSLRHSSPRLQRSKDHVTLRGSQQQVAKPAKSILVRRRQRNQAKHRSWSNPACEMDDLGPRHGYLPSYLVGNLRPVSLPDENLLHQTQSSITEEHSGSSVQLNQPQRWKSQTCLSEESAEGTAPVVPAEIVEGNEVTQEDEDDCEDCDYERFKAKKSVSFSEKIFYHSTSATTSPLDSPKCPQVALMETTPENSSAAIKKSVDCKTLIDDSKFQADPDDAEMPPTDFIVSPNLSPSSSLSSSDVTLSTDILHKRELVFDVMRAVEVLVKYFSQTRDSSKKVQLGSTMENGEIGHLVLEHLCPAIHAVVLDGLKPHVNSLFGKVKNSACKVMEDSAELGQPIELIQGLVKSLKSLKFLNTPWLLFNAFIFGLLNYKALDFWLTYIHNHKSLLARHYTSSSFIHLSNSAAHRLFLDMITSLQPLAQMPFRLEYSFEMRMLDRRQQEQLAEYLLDRHVSRSVETYIEGQQFLAQLENLSSSQQVLQHDEMLSAAASESKLKQRTKQLWQKTQRHLVEKLSASKERLASESTTLIRSVRRAAVNRKPRPMSLPGTFQVDNLKYAHPPACVSSVRSLAPLESMELLGSSDASCLVESSSGSESDGGFFLRITKQLKDMNLGGRVYRRGVTNYSFEDLHQKPVVTSSDSVDHAKSVENDTKATLTSKPDVSIHQPTNVDLCETVNSGSRCDALSDVERTERDSTENVDKMYLRSYRPSQAHAASKLATAVACRNASSGTAGALGARAVNLANGQSTRNPLQLSSTGRTDLSTLEESVTKKRWSDFGSRLVNIFDRLLLSDTMATATAKTSSSSVVKCQSMGQISNDAVDERSGIRGRQLSTSTQLFKAHSLDSSAGYQTKTVNMKPVSQNPRSARALCHYVAADSQQLSFEKGSLLFILQDSDPDWKLCRLGESEGLVHNACLRMDDIPHKVTSQ